MIPTRDKSEGTVTLIDRSPCPTLAQRTYSRRRPGPYGGPRLLLSCGNSQTGARPSCRGLPLFSRPNFALETDYRGKTYLYPINKERQQTRAILLAKRKKIFFPDCTQTQVGFVRCLSHAFYYCPLIIRVLCSEKLQFTNSLFSPRAEALNKCIE